LPCHNLTSEGEITLNEGEFREQMLFIKRLIFSKPYNSYYSGQNENYITIMTEELFPFLKQS